MIPTIRTERLTLRPYRFEDFPAYRDFLAGPRSRFMSGPHGAETAWAWFCNDTASWQFFGFGGLMIEAADGTLAGGVNITQGPDFPEPELGWFLFDGAEGKGYATEAALALRDALIADLPSLVSYIDRGNAPALRLAKRLGAERDAQAATPGGLGCLVLRHRVRVAS
ncbi:GNAT family N-acetyltransferase [Pelagovum pacificum]|uniref:GNAT family N-acetyltransferase n=1 Tax=Pelagovum pacificum TaxID=2588711 RepID=A0A5C5GHR3_9RHOB|nr:GNAT family N-acetyltransferase [Pelagovum pacificum]QQA43432.1 GNAT family N-acetyltransferase [Pelagovum pacificum]TNY33431.1 GNAT family N-acetyltransferase [Pelagovum pacificum]